MNDWTGLLSESYDDDACKLVLSVTLHLDEKNLFASGRNLLVDQS